MSSVTILYMMKKLQRDFYLRDVNLIARDLLGKILVHESDEGIASGVIVETEAYKGPEDKAAHTYNNRRTSRTEIQFREGGYAYVYMIYGMYFCFNVTANLPNMPEAVLIRALEPLDGVDLMKGRRKTDKLKNLCSGPGKLCAALGINKEDNGEDLCGGKIYILDGGKRKLKIKTSPRINIDYAEEYKNFLWRYFIEGNEFVS
ncbi:MAG: DNA-3-methyladenine glycosylase [Synergistaceae bacterium]|nr:DNA-3-methyladenine glycosylase [Synergistaceae bacterium]